MRNKGRMCRACYNKRGTVRIEFLQCRANDSRDKAIMFTRQCQQGNVQASDAVAQITFTQHRQPREKRTGYRQILLPKGLLQKAQIVLHGVGALALQGQELFQGDASILPDRAGELIKMSQRHGCCPIAPLHKTRRCREQHQCRYAFRMSGGHGQRHEPSQ